MSPSKYLIMFVLWKYFLHDGLILLEYPFARPILINLRDHTKLTIPLLRGIARLLSLLSSWFNKALGEKMIEHLSKFTEADKITSLQLWNLGDEPKVAAAVMDLFALLPQASRFVEALVKSTLRSAVFLVHVNAIFLFFNADLMVMLSNFSGWRLLGVYPFHLSETL